VIGVTEVSKENLEKVNATIFETLDDISKNGFDKNLTDAALHQIELNSRIIGSNFGLNLFMSLISAVNHGLPELIDRNLEIGKNLEEIREKIDAGGYFEGIVKKYFLDNPKRVTLTTNPDSGLLDSKDWEETKRLKKTQKSLTETDQAKIIADCVMLQKQQEQIQDNSILPTLKVSDIEPRETEIDSQKFEVNGVPVTYFTHCPDGVTFIQLKFSTKQIDES
jgi:Zn-dependent M16 (insulinase) family peptidase